MRSRAPINTTLSVTSTEN